MSLPRRIFVWLIGHVTTSVPRTVSAALSSTYVSRTAAISSSALTSSQPFMSPYIPRSASAAIPAMNSSHFTRYNHSKPPMRISAWLIGHVTTSVLRTFSAALSSTSVPRTAAISSSVFTSSQPSMGPYVPRSASAAIPAMNSSHFTRYNHSKPPVNNFIPGELPSIVKAVGYELSNEEIVELYKQKKRIPCGICSHTGSEKYFANGEGLEQHIKALHAGINMITCARCRTYSLEGLKIHQTRVGKFHCPSTIHDEGVDERNARFEAEKVWALGEKKKEQPGRTCGKKESKGFVRRSNNCSFK